MRDFYAQVPPSSPILDNATPMADVEMDEKWTWYLRALVRLSAVTSNRAAPAIIIQRIIRCGVFCFRLALQEGLPRYGRLSLKRQVKDQ
jgi:hypothetical protein